MTNADQGVEQRELSNIFGKESKMKQLSQKIVW